MFWLAVEQLRGFLRRFLRSEGWFWQLLRALRRKIASQRDNPLNRRRWKRNRKAFDLLLTEASSEDQGFFVLQVGACDGIMADPIYRWVIEHEWRGLLVEPQKDEFLRLKENYRGSDMQFENAAIAAHDGQIELYKVNETHIAADWQRGTASVLPRPDLVESGTLDVEVVDCVTFATLLARHRVKQIDLLQIDVEGFDFEVIKLFDFHGMPPRFLRYEHKHLSASDRLSCKRLLRSYGYDLLEDKFDTAAHRQQGQG